MINPANFQDLFIHGSKVFFTLRSVCGEGDSVVIGATNYNEFIYHYRQVTRFYRGVTFECVKIESQPYEPV